MKDRQDTFCGLGASMVAEILHLAKIHPLERASFVFTQGDSRLTRLAIVDAISQFISWIQGHEYSIRVPPTSSSVSAFDVNRSITRYIVGTTHVYRKTQGKARIPLDMYEALVKKSLVTRTPAKNDPGHRLLPVFMWK